MYMNPRIIFNTVKEVFIAQRWIESNIASQVKTLSVVEETNLCQILLEMLKI